MLFVPFNFIWGFKKHTDQNIVSTLKSILLSPAVLGPPVAKCWKSWHSLCNWPAKKHWSPCVELSVRFRIYAVIHLWHRQFTGMCSQCSILSSAWKQLFCLLLHFLSMHRRRDLWVRKSWMEERGGSRRQLGSAGPGEHITFKELLKCSTKERHFTLSLSFYWYSTWYFDRVQKYFIFYSAKIRVFLITFLSN